MAMVEKIKNKLRGNGFLLAVTIVLFFVLYIAGAILYGDRNFTSPQVFLNLFISNAGLIIAAVGMTFVLITGGIDISIGSVIGVVCMMLAWMMEVKHMSAVVAIILVLAFGVIFGLVQGFLVAYLKIQPFIVTLGGMFFARGLTALISSDMISIENPTFLSLANYRIYFGFITYKEKYDPEDIYECPVCIVESEIHMVQALEDIKKAGCDALVVYLGNFGPEISETL